MHEKAVIYFMSGTGNSLKVSDWMADVIKSRGIPVSVIPIEQADPLAETDENTLTGFAYPTHGFTVPWHMLKFLLRLPKRKTEAFITATRGGLKFGHIFTPGINASGNFIASLILWYKGYKVKGIDAFDMPSNWMSLHSGLSRGKAEAVIGHTKPKAERFIKRILDEKTNWLTWNNLYETVWTLLLFWLGALYLLAGRIFLAKLFFANYNCDGCGVCKDNCPVKAIAITDGRNGRPYWKHNCESCMRCMAYCPKQAIEAQQSWGILIVLIWLMPLSFYFFTWLGSFIPALAGMGHIWYLNLTDFLLLYPMVLGLYLILYGLSRISLVNKILSYTTLTHYYRRYHEPSTGIKRLSKKQSLL